VTEHRYILAADIGQTNDYTALVVLHSYGEEQDRRHDLVQAERFREVPYPEQVRRICQRFHALEEHAQSKHVTSRAELIVDATGVGKPILDELRAAGLRARGVQITGGTSVTSDKGMHYVPKRELVTTLQVALQAKRLRIAHALPLAEVLVREFRGFRVRINATGHASFGNDVGAWREADHDDLVLATALGVWALEYRARTSAKAREQLRNAMW